MAAIPDRVVSPDSNSTPGWYGKLSSLGDFASRRLSSDWIETCDDWLSRSMSASRLQLGDDWLETYLAAPLWRFAWAPGVIDKRWWFGVLMPSCDNVGRYFPLIIVQARDRAPVDRIALDHLELWWSHVARAAVQTLQDQAAIDDFEVDLAAVPPWSSAGAALAISPTSAQDRLRISAPVGAGLVDVAGALASHDMLARLAGCTIWWPTTDAGVASCLTIAQGLPEASRFADLLTGRW